MNKALQMIHITYSYTIEIGPLTSEYESTDDFSFGFHVKEEKLLYVVRRAYILLREYMKTFVDKLKEKTQIEINKKSINE